MFDKSSVFVWVSLRCRVNSSDVGFTTPRAVASEKSCVVVWSTLITMFAVPVA